MFAKLFKSGPQMQPMQRTHILRAIEIIAETDEDDAEEAEQGFLSHGCDGMFVLTQGTEMLGLTGAIAAEGTEGAVWLSWTYLTESAQGGGNGRYMVEELLRDLNEHGIRKMFISTSDYKEDGVDVYGSARKFYEKLGAVEELRVPGYHAKRETKIVYGLENPGVETSPIGVNEVAEGVRFDGLSEAPESEGGVAMLWADGPAGVSGLTEAIDSARQQDARILFAALPDDLSRIASNEFSAHGFSVVGRLEDFYDVGMPQVWWSLSLK